MWKILRSALGLTAVLLCVLLPQRWMWPICALNAVVAILPRRATRKQLLARHGLLIVGPTIFFTIRGLLHPLGWAPWVTVMIALLVIRNANWMTPKFRIVTAISACIASLVLILHPQWSSNSTRPVPKSTVIVCAGDSLTAGVNNDSDTDTYPTTLRRSLGCTVINAGRAGDHVTGLLARLDADVLAHHPSIVLLFIGGNDSLGNTPRAEFAAKLDALVARITAFGAHTVVVHVPSGIVMDPYAGIYETTAARYNATLVPESWLRFRYMMELLARERLPDPMTLDGIHFSPSGAKLIAEWLEPYLRAAAAVAPS